MPVSDSEKIPEESKVSERTTEKSEQSAKIHPENTEKKQRKKKDRKEDSDSASKIEQITEKIKCTYHKFCDKINEITEKKDNISDEHRTLSGDLSIRGRLYVITPVVTAIRLILSKAVRRSFKDIRNFKL